MGSLQDKFVYTNYYEGAEDMAKNETSMPGEVKNPAADKKMREFDKGATRDTEQNKLDYEAFNNPLVDKRYAEYMNAHRQTANGLRDGDNWQSLFGDEHFDVCIKSLCRHTVDARLAHKGYVSEQPIEKDLCAIIFNAKAYLLKLLLDRKYYAINADAEQALKIKCIAVHNDKCTGSMSWNFKIKHYHCTKCNETWTLEEAQNRRKSSPTNNHKPGQWSDHTS